MAHGNHETEIKLPVRDPRSAGQVLRASGFRISKRRVLEVNWIFDTPELELRESRQVVRIRQAGSTCTLTYKGAPQPRKHKSREELEMRIPDAGIMKAILERLRYLPVFRYDKYRTEYRGPDPEGLATLDETPVGTYLELEGTPDWIDRTAALLHFSERDYITASYGLLYREWCVKRGIEPTHMVFDSVESGAR